MSKSPEQFNTYSEEEASKIQEEAKTTETEDYTEVEKRKNVEKELSEMLPLSKDEALTFGWLEKKTYEEHDPNGLLKNYYEKEVKPYIKDGKLKESELLHDLCENIERDIRCKKIEMQTADDIKSHLKRVAVTSIYFDNNRQIARQALENAFQILNNSNIEKTRDDGRCACSFVSNLGWVANRLGFPDLADKFGKNTICFNDPNYPNPSTTMYKYGHGPNSIGEDYTVDTVKDNLLRDVEDQINTLRHEEKRQIVLDELTKREYIQVDDVVDIVGLSNRWAKRMLDVLEERGKIIRKKEGYTLKPDSSAGK